MTHVISIPIWSAWARRCAPAPPSTWPANSKPRTRLRPDKDSTLPV